MGVEQQITQIPGEKETDGMITPRDTWGDTASLIDGDPCGVEAFGLPLPLVQDDFVCTVQAPAMPSNDLQISSVSTAIDDSWELLATLDNTDMLPSPPTSPIESPSVQEASMCGTDMTYDVAPECVCSAAEPLDELDLLLQRAEVDINLDGIQLCDIEFASAEESGEESPDKETQDASVPPETDERVDYQHSSVDRNRSAGVTASDFENKLQSPVLVTAKTQSSEPRRKVRKVGSHEPWRDPADKEGKGRQTLLDAQMAAFELFETSSFDAIPFDATPLQPRLEPKRRVLRALNSQRQPATAA